jgi:Uma2 family endonuclease
MSMGLYLTPADQGRALTLAEFEHAGGEEGYRYELIDGKLEVSPLPNMPHDVVRKWLERLLDRYAEKHSEVINRVHAPARVFVPDRPGVTTPEPDLAAYQNVPRELGVDGVNWQDVSPLLVAEILSRDTADKDLVRNRDLYVQVPSIREYWIIDPRAGGASPSLTV